METNTTPVAGGSIAPTKPPRKLATRTAKPAPKKVGKAAAPKAAKAAPASDGIALKSILAKLKIDGRPARRKLRASGLKFHGHRERWTFSPAQAKQVTAILLGKPAE